MIPSPLPDPSKASLPEMLFMCTICFEDVDVVDEGWMECKTCQLVFKPTRRYPYDYEIDLSYTEDLRDSLKED